MKMSTMNMTLRTTLLQHTQNEFHQQDEFILNIVSKFLEMQLRYS